jgi:alanyl-tRNA synthetase
MEILKMFILNNQNLLPPTEKIWIEYPYLTECEATILYVQDNYLVTDKTIFYPESGGQVADRGWINEVHVVDVQKQPGHLIHVKRAGIDVPSIQINTVVVHVVEAGYSFQVGQKVNMRLDWQLRYLHMRYHSASHFLYHAVSSIYGKDGKTPYIRGCHIYAESARFDYADNLDSSCVPEVSFLANALISEGQNITMEPDPSTKDISYWQYGNIIIPCGGTHVRHASEIGSISVKRKKTGKATTRMYIYLNEVDCL